MNADVVAIMTTERVAGPSEGRYAECGATSHEWQLKEVGDGTQEVECLLMVQRPVIDLRC